MAGLGATDLHSLRARGQFKKTYVYYVVNGVQKRRGYAVPNDPNTPRQQARKAFFRNGSEYWYNLPAGEKEAWTVASKKIKQAWDGKNYFLRKWLKGEIVVDLIKSIQRGTEVCADGANDVTIVGVEMARSIVVYGSYHCGSSLGAADEHGVSGMELTSATNLRIHAVKGAQADAPSAYWQVVEFY